MLAPDDADAAAASPVAAGTARALLEDPASPVPTRILAQFGRASVLALRTGTRRRVFAPTLSVHPLLQSGDVPLLRSGDVRGAARPARAVGDALAAWSAQDSTGGGPGWDWHLRRELAVRLLGRAATATGAAYAGDLADRGGLLLAWTRPGPAESEDADHGWWSAAGSACSEVDVSLACLLVITRWGWWTLPEGPARRWDRLRHHGGGSR